MPNLYGKPKKKALYIEIREQSQKIFQMEKVAADKNRRILFLETKVGELEAKIERMKEATLSSLAIANEEINFGKKYVEVVDARRKQFLAELRAKYPDEDTA